MGLSSESADTHPDHSTFNEFRKRHLEASGLFLQAGIVPEGETGACGGRRDETPGERQQAQGDRMRGAEETLKAEVEELLKRRSTRSRMRSNGKD